MAFNELLWKSVLQRQSTKKPVQCWEKYRNMILGFDNPFITRFFFHLVQRSKLLRPRGIWFRLYFFKNPCRNHVIFFFLLLLCYIDRSSFGMNFEEIFYMEKKVFNAISTITVYSYHLLIRDAQCFWLSVFNLGVSIHVFFIFK